MTCVRCLLASREKVPAAPWRVKGERARKDEVSKTTSMGGAMGGAIMARPRCSTRVTPQKFFIPVISLIADPSSLSLSPSFSCSYPARGVSRRGYSVSVLRAGCSNLRREGRGATSNDKSAGESLALLAFVFDTLHRSSFGEARGVGSLFLA